MDKPRWVLCLVTAMVLVLPRSTAGLDEYDQLDTAARRYRMQVYQSFRANRAELDQRLRLSHALLNGWRDRGAPVEEIPELASWYRNATQLMRRASHAPLPQYVVRPEFASRTAKPKTAQTAPHQVAPDLESDRETRSAVATGGLLEADSMAENSGSDLSLSQPRETRVSDAGERPDDLPPVRDQDVLPERPSITKSLALDQLPNVRLRRSASRSVLIEHRQTESAPATPVESHAEPMRATASRSHAEVDLDVLQAKIRSLNLSITAIETELSEREDWTIDVLEAYAEELSRLINRAELVQLYCDAIPYEQRENMTLLGVLGPAKALLAQRAFELRIRLSRATETSDAIAVTDQLNRLKRLSEVMQQWIHDEKK